MDNNLEEIINGVIVLYNLTNNITLKVKKINVKWIIYQQHNNVYETEDIITITDTAGEAGACCYVTFNDMHDINCPVQNLCLSIPKYRLQIYLCSILDNKFHLK